MPRVAITAQSKVGQDEVISDLANFKFSRAVAAQSKVGQDSVSIQKSKFSRALGVYASVGRDEIRLNPKFSRALGAEATVGEDDFKTRLLFARALQVDTTVGRDEIQLLTLLGGATVQPHVQVSLNQNGQEVSFNGAKIHRNDSAFVNIQITGERIASEINGTMNVTLTAKISPDNKDEFAVFRKTIQNGGIEWGGVRNVTTYDGIRKRSIYLARILPKDTEAITQTTTLIWDLQIDDGLENGERYTPIWGYFTITKDVFKGVGGAYSK